MDDSDYEKSKLPAKRFRDHVWENVFQPVTKTPRYQENCDRSSPSPGVVVGKHFTINDLQRCLFSQNEIRVLNIQMLTATQQRCDACLEDKNFQCPKHKHKTPASQQTRQLPMAVSSLPPEVGLCTSSIPGAGCGICARKKIPVGAWIGPYEGRFVTAEDLKPSTDTSYMWEIFKGGKLSGYIDAKDLNVTSWMRFIRCARHKLEQNLFAFQYLGRVFYRAFKTILPGEEMLVWYDEKYPQYLGIPAAIFDMGDATLLGVSLQPDEDTVVSNRRTKHKDTLPPNTNTADNVFPSPPPSPLSSSQSPIPFFRVPLASPASPHKAKDGPENATSKKYVPIHGHHRDIPLRHLARDHNKTSPKATSFVHEQSTLATDSVLYGPSSQSLHTDNSTQATNHYVHCAAPSIDGNQLPFHEIKKQFVCRYCSISFSEALTLNNHMQLHSYIGTQFLDHETFDG